jgi:hypothetical protein
MTQRQRRKLSAVDDPLESPAEAVPATAPPPPAAPADRAGRSGGADRQALFVRLPALEADSLARAAFELRLHKREIVAALIAQHVDARSADGLASVGRLVEEYRDARG